MRSSDLLRTVPDLRVVLDHLGKPPVDEGIASDAGARWRDGIRSLAALPGLHVKLSGLPAESADAAAYDAHVDDFIRFGLEAFGPERSMLGSDWPVSALLGAGEPTPRSGSTRVRAADGPRRCGVGPGRRRHGHRASTASARRTEPPRRRLVRSAGAFQRRRARGSSMSPRSASAVHSSSGMG